MAAIGTLVSALVDRAGSKPILCTQPNMKPCVFVGALLVAAACVSAWAQTATAVPYKPKPAFPGQTEAPAPAKPSDTFEIKTITNRLSGPWSVAFLPDGNFLVTEGAGTMRIVRPDRTSSGRPTPCHRRSVAAASPCRHIHSRPG